MQAGGNFSAVAGAVSLAFIVLPVLLRTTDEMLRLLPAPMRVAALSLGVPQMKVILQVMFRSSMPCIVTGILLSLALSQTHIVGPEFLRTFLSQCSPAPIHKKTI